MSQKSALRKDGLFGLMAEFKDPDDLLKAAEEAYAQGYRSLDAFSPFPIHGLAEAIGFKRTALPWIVFAGGLTGLLVAFALQYWVSVLNYPLNVGGRPLNSWPSFVIVCFEMTILFSAISAVLGMLALNGLPRPHHPVFNVTRFREHASQDRFYLCIEAQDARFDREQTRRFLEGLNPVEVSEVDE